MTIIQPLTLLPVHRQSLTTPKTDTHLANPPHNQDGAYEPNIEYYSLQCPLTQLHKNNTTPLYTQTQQALDLGTL